MLYILNTLITPINFDHTDQLVVRFQKISLEEAREILKKEEWKSVVGHEGTAKLLSELLGLEIPFNRETVYFKRGDKAIHFFLKQRLPEGAVLSKEEIEKLEYWLVLSEVL